MQGNADQNEGSDVLCVRDEHYTLRRVPACRTPRPADLWRLGVDSHRLPPEWLIEISQYGEVVSEHRLQYFKSRVEGGFIRSHGCFCQTREEVEARRRSLTEAPRRPRNIRWMDETQPL